MEQFVPVTDLTTPSESFNEEVEVLMEAIREQDIPKWILIPKRSAGEHATGGAWNGVVMAECFEAQRHDKDTATIDARIAWDAKERSRGKSTVTDVPEALRQVVAETEAELDNVSMCLARIAFDAESMEPTGIQIGHLVENEETEEA